MGLIPVFTLGGGFMWNQSLFGNLYVLFALVYVARIHILQFSTTQVESAAFAWTIIRMATFMGMRFKLKNTQLFLWISDHKHRDHEGVLVISWPLIWVLWSNYCYFQLYCIFFLFSFFQFLLQRWTDLWVKGLSSVILKQICWTLTRQQPHMQTPSRHGSQAVFESSTNLL